MKLLMYTHAALTAVQQGGGLEECRTVPVVSCSFVLYVNLMCVCVCVCLYYDSSRVFENAHAFCRPIYARLVCNV